MRWHYSRASMVWDPALTVLTIKPLTQNTYNKKRVNRINDLILINFEIDLKIIKFLQQV